MIALRLATALLLIAALGTTARGDPMRVAVLEFDSTSADSELAPLGKGLQSMLTTDLSKVSSLRVVERQRLRDVQAEIAVARGAGFDQKTAARIGKLVGATHLFGGSLSIAADRMRLDGRLVAVASGEVLLAEQIVGEKALFFELEQELVKKVIGALGVRVEPREKAALLKPHTADFKAFQRFSAGVQAFDDGRVAQATAALREAAAIDADFELATLTLAEYERLAAQVRGKADAAGNLEAEQRRLKQNRDVAAGLEIMQRLWAIADAPASSPDGKLRRYAALCTLARQYEAGFRLLTPGGKARDYDYFRAGYDGFTRARMADAVYQRVWQESPPLVPRTAPFCVGVRDVRDVRSLDATLKEQITSATTYAARNDLYMPELGGEGLVNTLSERLVADAAGAARIAEEVLRLAVKLPGFSDEDRARLEEHIAVRRRRAGDLDGSTKMFASASRHTGDSRHLKALAEQVDNNKRLTAALGPGAPPLLREMFLLSDRESPAEIEKLRAPDRAKELERRVFFNRRVSTGERLLFDELAVWPVIAGGSDGGELFSGPRSLPERSAELRYVAPACNGRGGGGRSGHSAWRRCEDPVVVASARHGAVFAAEVVVDGGPPPKEAFHWRHDLSGTGLAGIAFGLGWLDEAGDAPEHQGPPLVVGWAVLLAGDRARLVEIRRSNVTDVAVMAEARLGAARGPRKLAVAVREPAQLEVTVDGQRVPLAWKPSRDIDGFVGFAFYGAGYAALRAPNVRVEKPRAGR
jgi:TolB-like protein